MALPRSWLKFFCPNWSLTMLTTGVKGPSGAPDFFLSPPALALFAAFGREAAPDFPSEEALAAFGLAASLPSWPSLPLLDALSGLSACSFLSEPLSVSTAEHTCPCLLDPAKATASLRIRRSAKRRDHQVRQAGRQSDPEAKATSSSLLGTNWLQRRCGCETHRAGLRAGALGEGARASTSNTSEVGGHKRRCAGKGDISKGLVADVKPALQLGAWSVAGWAADCSLRGLRQAC